MQVDIIYFEKMRRQAEYEQNRIVAKVVQQFNKKGRDIKGLLCALRSEKEERPD